LTSLIYIPSHFHALLEMVMHVHRFKVIALTGGACRVLLVPAAQAGRAAGAAGLGPVAAVAAVAGQDAVALVAQAVHQGRQGSRQSGRPRSARPPENMCYPDSGVLGGHSGESARHKKESGRHYFVHRHKCFGPWGRDWRNTIHMCGAMSFQTWHADQILR
jgi:hypothetical protein